MAQAIDTLDRTRRLLGVNTRLDTLMDDLNRRRAAACRRPWPSYTVPLGPNSGPTPSCWPMLRWHWHRSTPKPVLWRWAWRAVEPATIPHPARSRRGCRPVTVAVFLVGRWGWRLSRLSKQPSDFRPGDSPVDIPWLPMSRVIMPGFSATPKVTFWKRFARTS
jgi:hypothetical protein